MNKIPTAEEFFNNKSEQLNSDKEDMPLWMIEASIEFAKLHVEEALKEANKKAIMTGYIDSGQTILNTYPLENIK